MDTTHISFLAPVTKTHKASGLSIHVRWCLHYGDKVADSNFEPAQDCFLASSAFWGLLVIPGVLWLVYSPLCHSMSVSPHLCLNLSCI